MGARDTVQLAVFAWNVQSPRFNSQPRRKWTWWTTLVVNHSITVIKQTSKNSNSISICCFGFVFFLHSSLCDGKRYLSQKISALKRSEGCSDSILTHRTSELKFSSWSYSCYQRWEPSDWPWVRGFLGHFLNKNLYASFLFLSWMADVYYWNLEFRDWPVLNSILLQIIACHTVSWCHET